MSVSKRITKQLRHGVVYTGKSLQIQKLVSRTTTDVDALGFVVKGADPQEIMRCVT